MRRIVIFLLLCFAGLPAQQTISNPDRVERWKEDLRFLSLTLHGTPVPGEKKLPGQKDFAKLYPHFDADITALEADLPNVRNGAIYWRLAKIMAGAHVAHNMLIPGDPQMLPLLFEWMDEGPVVIAANADFKATVGTRVVKIGNLTSAEFLTIVSPYISYETEGWQRSLAGTVMRRRALLELLGLVQDDNVALTFEGANGQTTVAVPFAPAEAKLIPFEEALGFPVLFVRSQTGYYWRQYLADRQTLYIQYNRCADDPNLKFSDFTAQTLAIIDESKPQRVIVDLRFNQGGNSQIIGPLTSGLASRRKIIGTPFVLIGANTFSSGVWAARDLRLKAKAHLVGTPTGGLYGGYGESPSRVLPYSKLGFQWTIKRFGSPEPERPGITAMMTAADLRMGRDPVLAAAIEAPR